MEDISHSLIFKVSVLMEGSPFTVRGDTFTHKVGCFSFKHHQKFKCYSESQKCATEKLQISLHND